MSYCKECGSKLTFRRNGLDGDVPYCETCKAFRFPQYNVAISTIVMNEAMDQIILIQQYGRTDNILVAGYVNLGESLEEGLKREVHEELGLTVTKCQYLRSKYFEKSNTLMCNFLSVVDDMSLDHINEEIDRISWFSLEEAKACIKPGSLAQEFLNQGIADLLEGRIRL
ncbi:MAG: NUDIX domain-containing protein [Lachnospiraceae bacterium]|nr:NUDIX domain-containing protein [Lachnospiraceae bacterium]